MPELSVCVLTVASAGQQLCGALVARSAVDATERTSERASVVIYGSAHSVSDADKEPRSLQKSRSGGVSPTLSGSLTDPYGGTTLSAFASGLAQPHVEREEESTRPDTPPQQDFPEFVNRFSVC